MPPPAAAGASSSVPANTDDFAPAVSAMMALMDGSPMTPADPPQTPEHHRAEEDHPEEEEAQHPAICCICHDVLIQSGMEVEALPCGHVSHSECLAQCRDVGGFVGTWCPFKCHDSTTATRNVPPQDDDTWEII